MIDFTRGFAKSASARLRSQYVIWLTTVDSENAPLPRPVWFHWDGSTILIFSQQGTAKLRHIRRNPAVSINLNSDPKAGEVTVILGKASILGNWPDGPRVNEYLDKYRAGIKGLGFTTESFRAEYNTAIEIQPTRVQGF